jgi:hypothetical protein
MKTITKEEKLKVRRWLRALEIAKILFEEEGYHVRYLEQIETHLKNETNPNLAK